MPSNSKKLHVRQTLASGFRVYFRNSPLPNTEVSSRYKEQPEAPKEDFQEDQHLYFLARVNDVGQRLRDRVCSYLVIQVERVAVFSNSDVNGACPEN